MLSTLPAPHRSFLEGPCWPSSPDCGSGVPGSCCVRTSASGTQQAKGAAPPLWELWQGRPRVIPVHGSPRADIQGARREVSLGKREEVVRGGTCMGPSLEVGEPRSRCRDPRKPLPSYHHSANATPELLKSQLQVNTCSVPLADSQSQS